MTASSDARGGGDTKPTMTDNDRREPANDGQTLEPDGGTVSEAAETHRNTDYLDMEVNLLKPSTPFMREHLKLVWGTFVAWTLVVWGPVTLTYFAPDTMSSITVLGFPLHYVSVALGAPTGSLVLAAICARAGVSLDEKYGIEHGATDREGAGSGAGATDGGVDE